MMATSRNLQDASGPARAIVSTDALDCQRAEREDDQDQEREAPRIDPEKQAAQRVGVVGVELEVLAKELADRETSIVSNSMPPSATMIAAATANGRASDASRTSLMALVAAI